MLGKLFDTFGETVQNDRIPLVIDHVFHLAHQALQPRWGEPELEDGKLYPLTVPLADGGKAPEPGGATLAGVGNVVGEQNIHRSRKLFKEAQTEDRREGHPVNGEPAT